MKFKLFRNYPDYEYHCGDALLVDNVFNLVTKKKCWHKPTYESLREALEMMREVMELDNVTKLAMPWIGCGLDRLQRDQVYDIICEVFEDTDVEIVICEI